MMEHNHWGLEDYFHGWFPCESSRVYPLTKLLSNSKSCWYSNSPRSDQNVNGPEASTKPFLNTSQNLWKGSVIIIGNLLKDLSLRIGKPKIPHKFSQNSHRNPPQECSPLNTIGWLAACSFRKCVNWFCLGGFAKLQELGIIMLRLTYHQLCPYPSHQNTNAESYMAMIAKFRTHRESNRCCHIEYSNDKNFQEQGFWATAITKYI